MSPRAALVRLAVAVSLGLGLAVWAVGLFEPGDVAIELPIVFVASTPVGDYNALVDFDVSGKLDVAVWGAAKKRPS